MKTKIEDFDPPTDEEVAEVIKQTWSNGLLWGIVSTFIVVNLIWLTV
jgi:hypothetical protein